MRIAFVCNDTQGGVQPYVGIARELKHRGHDVRLIAPENYAHFATNHGLEYRPMQGDVQTFLKSEEFLSTKGVFAKQKLMLRKGAEFVGRWTEDTLAGCEGVETIVAGIGGHLVAEAVAEKLGVRYVQAHLQPLTPTGSLPAPLAPSWFSMLGGFGNRLGYFVSRQIMWQPQRGMVNRARRNLLKLGKANFWGNLGKVKSPTKQLLYGFSRHVLPPPKSWENRIYVTGYWFLDEAETWQPPENLSQFLASGPAPIVVGFGSMSDRDSELTMQIVLESVKQTGQRAVVLSGWGGFANDTLSDDICVLRSAPHDWLYPRASLVIHHGGAGTTGAVFRAGVPGIVIPFGAEQPFWGRRVASLGCGSKPIPRRKLTSKKLVEAIRYASQETIRQRASELGEFVRSEKGVHTAADLILS